MNFFFFEKSSHIQCYTAVQSKSYGEVKFMRTSVKVNQFYLIIKLKTINKVQIFLFIILLYFWKKLRDCATTGGLGEPPVDTQARVPVIAKTGEVVDHVHAGDS